MNWKILTLAVSVLLASSAAVAVLAGPGDTPPDPPAVTDEPVDGNGDGDTLGVPPDSPACESWGCDTVVNAGGNELHLPQPAVDGINRAAANRAEAPGHADGHGRPDDVPRGDPHADGHGRPDDVPRGDPHADGDD